MKIRSLIVYTLIIFFSRESFAQNPVIRNQFSADPSARVFGDSVYVYPSHDILPKEGAKRKRWFCMEDYHVFSSANLTDWTDHGIIVSQNKVNWADSISNSMWAPDCMSNNGKYYFYFPSFIRDTIYAKGFGIGIAVSDKPYGPFIAEAEPIKDVHGIDPCLFIDNDGQVYLYWAFRNLFVSKLKQNMLELESKPQVIIGTPDKGLKEGPFLFERNGIYYLTYPHVENVTERLEYAMGNNPLGPFKYAGVLMDESPTGCWTNQQSIVEFKGQWYLFYHENDLSPNFDKNRSVRIDSLFFNTDGTIQKVTPTLRGVGLTIASQKIQMDRYSDKSRQGSSVDFLDTLNRFKGWKTILDSKNAWIQYNRVDFGKGGYKSLQVTSSSATGGVVQLRMDKPDGPLLAEVIVPDEIKWTTYNSNLLKFPAGIHNLVIELKDENPVEIDWICFTK